LHGVVLVVFVQVLARPSDQINTKKIPEDDRQRNICTRKCMRGRWPQEEMNEQEKTERTDGIVPCLGAKLLLTKEIAVSNLLDFIRARQDLIRGRQMRFGTFAFVHVKSDQSHG
jgi:hypothetical protein